MKNTLFFLCIFILIIIFACSLDTFSNFSVVSVSITENEVIGTEKKEIEIVFTKNVDNKKAEDNIRIEKDSSGEISFKHAILGNHVIITPEEKWLPHERYWLIISKEITDIYGKEMGKDFYLSFQSTDGLLPVSAVLVSPEIFCGILTNETHSIQIAFSSDVDRNSIEREFSISPGIDGYFEWTSDSSFKYHFEDSLEKNSFYSIQISNNAKDQYGYAIKSFFREFEYYPNQEYPGLNAVILDSLEIFNAGDPSTYSIEGGYFIIGYDEAEKDLVLRIEFSKPIEKTTFKDNFQVSPFREWHEVWLDEYTIEISFEENLKIDEYYEITINKMIKDMDGLNLQNNYVINMHVNGKNSQFLEFYAEDFTHLSVNSDDVELWLGSSKIDNGVQNVLLEKDNEGYVIKIDYDETKISAEDIPDIEVKWRVLLRFNDPIYVPVIDQKSLQDSLNFGLIFGNDSYSGSINSFNWEVGAGNECQVYTGEIGTDNVYFFSIDGGSKGVIDERQNYMEDDIKYFFKVILIHSF